MRPRRSSPKDCFLPETRARARAERPKWPTPRTARAPRQAGRRSPPRNGGSLVRVAMLARARAGRRARAAGAAAAAGRAAEQQGRRRCVAGSRRGARHQPGYARLRWSQHTLAVAPMSGYTTRRGALRRHAGVGAFGAFQPPRVALRCTFACKDAWRRLPHARARGGKRVSILRIRVGRRERPGVAGCARLGLGALGPFLSLLHFSADLCCRAPAARSVRAGG